MFQARIRRPQLGLRLITYLGFAVPLAIGLLVLGFGVDSPGLKAALPYAGAFLVVQGLLSAFAIVFGWQQRVDDGPLSSTESTRLFKAYKNLASLPPPDLEARVAVLEAQKVREGPGPGTRDRLRCTTGCTKLGGLWCSLVCLCGGA